MLETVPRQTKSEEPTTSRTQLSQLLYRDISYVALPSSQRYMTFVRVTLLKQIEFQEQPTMVVSRATFLHLRSRPSIPGLCVSDIEVDAVARATALTGEMPKD